MIISTFQEFYNSLKDAPLPIMNELGGCINLLNKICSCKKTQKQSKNDECNNLYINFVKSSGDSLIEYLKAKTNDNEITFKHSTHYEIITIRLR